MGLTQMIDTLKNHPDYPSMGMIASHLGVVRQTARDGGPVSGIRVTFDRDVVQDIVRNTKEMDGIIEVLVETYEGDLKVGDEIMAVVVGGDIRDHVFPALIHAVDAIKKKGAVKKEF